MLVITEDNFKVWLFLLIIVTVISPLSNRCHVFKEIGNWKLWFFTNNYAS